MSYVWYFKCFDEYRTHLHILATEPMLGHVEARKPAKNQKYYDRKTTDVYQK